MNEATDSERPALKLPYVRVERAGGLVLWLTVSVLPAIGLFLVGRMVEIARGPVTVAIVVYGIAALAALAELWLFEERCSIDTKTVTYRRRGLMGTTEWSERLSNYGGVAIVTPDKKGNTSENHVPRPHWSKRTPPKIIRLVNRDKAKSVTLWEFDTLDFSEAIAYRAMSLAELLGVKNLSKGA